MKTNFLIIPFPVRWKIYKSYCLFVILLALSYCSSISDKSISGENKSPRTLPSIASGNSCEQILQTLQEDPNKIDFLEFRVVCSRHKNSRAHMPNVKFRLEIEELLQQQRYDAALEKTNAMFTNNYTDIMAHVYLDTIYTKTGRKSSSIFHNYMVKGLMRSIIQSGDGTSPESAYYATTINEEYAFLEIMGYFPGQQSLVTANGHRYDVFVATNKQTGDSYRVYFNVDEIFRAHQRTFGGSLENN
ncbi:MAG: DUF4919 domain-containing protein [Spirochaetota bacterium]